MGTEGIDKQLAMLPLSQIEPNTGQLEGLPQNPRHITQAKFEKLKKNIADYPEMLAWRSLLVYPTGAGRYIIVGGNMRYKAMLELGHTEAPAVIIPEDTPSDRLRAYTILDNNGFGDWDWDLLANEWPDDMLDGWGLDIPPIPAEKKGKPGDGIKSYKIEIDCADEAEQEDLCRKLTEQGYSCRVVTM